MGILSQIIDKNKRARHETLAGQCAWLGNLRAFRHTHLVQYINTMNMCQWALHCKMESLFYAEYQCLRFGGTPLGSTVLIIYYPFGDTRQKESKQ